ncbi:MAG TPA: hypothetical protein VFJ90_08310 [Candidatus Didemnitutus sp.]|nr:hypothetical protein [Candidatus Didemnitutus sp.]
MFRCHLSPVILALLSLAASFARAEEAPAAGAAAVPTDIVKPIADLRTVLAESFSGGSWQGKIVNTANGCAVQGNKGADGKGELGQNLHPRLDLTGVKYVEVALATGPKNEVPAITVAFSDADDVQYTASIRVDQLVPGSPVWLRVHLSDFKLNNWKGDKTGRTINWAKIASWHLQGDWNTTAPCHVMFIALRTRQ